MEFKVTKLKLLGTPQENEYSFYFQSISTNKSDKLLFANAYGKTKKEAKANAQLIAHAPEMLDMLDKMRKAILSEDFTRMLCESQSAKELITKATTI